MIICKFDYRPITLPKAKLIVTNGFGANSKSFDKFSIGFEAVESCLQEDTHRVFLANSNASIKRSNAIKRNGASDVTPDISNESSRARRIAEAAQCSVILYDGLTPIEVFYYLMQTQYEIAASFKVGSGVPGQPIAPGAAEVTGTGGKFFSLQFRNQLGPNNEQTRAHGKHTPMQIGVDDSFVYYDLEMRETFRPEKGLDY